jgi:hypothetical protein
MFVIQNSQQVKPRSKFWKAIYAFLICLMHKCVLVWWWPVKFETRCSIEITYTLSCVDCYLCIYRVTDNFLFVCLIVSLSNMHSPCGAACWKMQYSRRYEHSDEVYGLLSKFIYSSVCSFNVSSYEDRNHAINGFPTQPKYMFLIKLLLLSSHCHTSDQKRSQCVIQEKNRH